jgi:hypothetical protein
MYHIVRAILCWVAAILAGAGADQLGMPLAWVLGPLVVTAAVSMMGAKAFAPLYGRRFGQIIIGAAIGLNMTPDAVENLLAWVPLMIATALVSTLIGATMSVGLARYGRVDEKSAFFAMVPGGLSEMANIGASMGARSEVIALSQALRVALAVCIMPPVVLALGRDGGIFSAATRYDVDWPSVALLLVAGFAGVHFVRLFRLANPWMLGSLVTAALLAASQVVEGHMPAPALWVGQFLVGIAIGARFKRDIVRRLFRLALVSSALTLLAGTLLLAVAAIIAGLTHIDIASAALGASPGGFAEMTVTAQTLHLDVALVAGFHVVRAFMVNSLTAHYWTILNRIGYFAAIARLLR